MRYIFSLSFIVIFFITGCEDKLLDQTPEQKTIEIYLDRATLPTIQQITKIISNKSTNKKLILWHRYPISDLNLLNSINAESFSTQSHLIKSLNEILLNEKFEKVIIHGNAYWAKDVIDIIKSINDLGIGINIQLEIYDDGSVEYVLLYKFSKLSDEEQAYKISLLKQNLEGSINGYYDFNHKIEEIYGLEMIYPTTYHLLRSDIFKTDLNLRKIKNLMKGNIKQMKWDYFYSFDKNQKDLFFSLTRFNPKHLNNLYNNSPNKNFIFIGSNIGTATAQQQISIINEAKNKNNQVTHNSIDGYDLFFKGHPSATFNTEIATSCAMTQIDNKIPFEALIMTNSLPDAVGGMGSSVFFSLPKSVENKFIFYKNGTDIENNALIQIMLKLDIVKKENVKLISKQ